MTTLRELLYNNSPAMEAISAGVVFAVMAAALVCAVMIYLIYRFFNNSAVYSAGFNLLIVMVCVVTAYIIITIGSNLVLSLGMVGALSIVRFRAAVKDPLDVGFLFWSVTAGLTAGARLYSVALLGTACIAIIYISFYTLRANGRGFLLIIRYAPENEAQITPLLSPIKYKLKNKNRTTDFVELTLEVKIKKNNDSYLDGVTQSPLCQNVALVEYTGEYT